MSDKWLWRTVRIVWVGYGRGPEDWQNHETVEVRYRPNDLGSVARATKTLEDAFRGCILSRATPHITITDDEVEATE